MVSGQSSLADPLSSLRCLDRPVEDFTPIPKQGSVRFRLHQTAQYGKYTVTWDGESDNAPPETHITKVDLIKSKSHWLSCYYELMLNTGKRLHVTVNRMGKITPPAGPTTLDPKLVKKLLGKHRKGKKATAEIGDISWTLTAVTKDEDVRIESATLSQTYVDAGYGLANAYYITYEGGDTAFITLTSQILSIGDLRKLME